MATSKARKVVPGSEKKALSNAKVIGEVDPAARIEVTVVLRPRAGAAGAPAAASERLPAQRRYVSRESFAAERGADPDDLAKVEAFAEEHHLTVVEASLPKRTVRLSGTVADLTEAFRPTLKKAKLGTRIIRARTGGLSVPADIQNAVVAVLGFDDRPAATPHLRFRTTTPAKAVRNAAAMRAEAAAAGMPRAHGDGGNGKRENGNREGVNRGNGNRGNGNRAGPRNAADGSFTPPQVARLYNFPPGLDGTGQCIAIIELNDFDSAHNPTGTGFRVKDLNAYFKALGLPKPKVTAVGVASNGGVGANVPGPDANADGEVMLDIEVAGAVAPGARIAVYFALNTDDGFLAAVNAALHDNVRKPSVISISWGSPEDANTVQARNAFDQVLQDAAALGVTVCCSSGDDGSSDIRRPQDRDGRPHVDFPASSPFALACGGTTLLGSGATINSETCWNDGQGATGGGVSTTFARPAYQAKAKVPKSPARKKGRGVPDVAGDADPNTGYQVRLVGGAKSVIGGTSAVSPLWAGLTAVINQRLATLNKPSAGFLNPVLYQANSGVFRDIVSGNNDIEGLGKYSAHAGWDACTGLGTPNVASLLAALGG